MKTNVVRLFELEGGHVSPHLISLLVIDLFLALSIIVLYLPIVASLNSTFDRCALVLVS